jgi:hypothetical protein
MGAFAFADGDNDDEAALALADRARVAVDGAHRWHAIIEAAAAESEQHDAESGQHSERLSLGIKYEDSIVHGLRAVFSDRLDIAWQTGIEGYTSINTLRDAYLSWHLLRNQIFDVGFVNARYGAAVGYNPTDYFRSDAVRSVTSLDPSSLKENRMGAVMVRAQTLWNEGSLTYMFLPRLAANMTNDVSTKMGTPASGSADSSATNGGPVDLGATNGKDRWLVALSQRAPLGFSPQFLLFGDLHGNPQAGLNLTYLISSSAVAYVEWSGGQGPTLVAQAELMATPKTFASRLSSGVTYTTPIRVSITLEYEQNTASPNRTQWDELRYGPPPPFVNYLNFIGNAQELATRQQFFAYVHLPDAAIRHLDIAAFTRLDLTDHSREDWMEFRYHWPRVDMAIQFQSNNGSAQTVFGASPTQRVGQAVVTYYF